MKITVPRRQGNRNPAFSKLLVSDTMRKQVRALPQHQSIASAIRTLIKFKADALLIEDKDGYPAGVVTKTEIMGAYYASMPLEMPLGDIMGSPVIHCSPDESLESALLTMQKASIHRIYVLKDNGRVIATLSYPDIVGALYRYCNTCDFSLRKRNADNEEIRSRYYIRDIMSKTITTSSTEESIIEVIEKLSSYHYGALLVVDPSGLPAGVISKTDLALAYRRGIDPEDKAGAIMSRSVQLCEENELLEDGIYRMVFSEVSRIFIYSGRKNTITGVLSLSDAARARSGSCQACTSTRLIMKQ